MKASKDSAEVSFSNRVFWDEPCGSTAFANLGFNSSAEFDKWYFDFYPYLESFIPFDDLQGKKVLEVGLGYGSVSQKIIESGASFHGLDIARSPVELVKERLKVSGVEGSVCQGSVLECPWDDTHFDFVVSIGCLHHTGDFIAGVEEVHRVLKKGGTAVMMVYNAFSYRQWITAPRSTFAQIFNEFGKKPTPRKGGEKERFRYDHNKKKDAAPCTQFIGKRGLLKILEPHFSEVVIRSENIGNSFFLRWLSRNQKLRYLGPIFGLDLYAVLKK